jgi:four helix bundle protein
LKIDEKKCSMRENVIKIKTFDFALKTVAAYRLLTEVKKEFILSKQFLRSGTAIGALVRESEHAESKPDFIHKLSIALKEANETEYWVELLYESNFIEDFEFKSLSTDLSEILRLLISIIKTAKHKQ